MKHFTFVVVIALFITGCANMQNNTHINTFESTEKALAIQNSQEGKPYDQYNKSQVENFNYLYINGKFCSEPPTKFILSIDKNGSVIDIWSSKGIKPAQCLLKLTKDLDFDAPPALPFYIKVEMRG